MGLHHARPPLPASPNKTVWPSGLRRWLKAPFRKGVGSNPTAVTLCCHALQFLLYTCCLLCLAPSWAPRGTTRTAYLVGCRRGRGSNPLSVALSSIGRVHATLPPVTSSPIFPSRVLLWAQARAAPVPLCCLHPGFPSDPIRLCCRRSPMPYVFRALPLLTCPGLSAPSSFSFLSLFLSLALFPVCPRGILGPAAFVLRCDIWQHTLLSTRISPSS